MAMFLAAAASRSAELPARLASAAQGSLQVGVRVGGAMPKRHPDTGTELPLLPCPFAAVVLAHGPSETTVPALHRLLDRTAPDIDVAASVLVGGIEYIVKPGDGSILAVMLVRRRPDYSAASFRDRWLGKHAAFGLRSPIAGYRQLHAEPAIIDGLPAANRFDGVGTIVFHDVDQARAARAMPEIARDATRDEIRFIDHAGSMLAMFRLIG